MCQAVRACCEGDALGGWARGNRPEKKMSSNRPEKLLHSIGLPAPVETPLISLDVEQQCAQKWHATPWLAQWGCYTAIHAAPICTHFSFSAKWLQMCNPLRRDKNTRVVFRIVSDDFVCYMLLKLHKWKSLRGEWQTCLKIVVDCCLVCLFSLALSQRGPACECDWRACWGSDGPDSLSLS